MPDQTNNTPPPDDDTPRARSPLHKPDRHAVGVDAAEPQPARRAPGSRFWLIPAATFLVGLVLGAAVLGLSRNGDGTDVADEPARGATPTVTVPATSPGGRTPATVTVPGSCLDVADSTEELLALARQATEAARDLNASRLSSVVRQLQESQTRLQQQSNACRDAASDAVVSPTAN